MAEQTAEETVEPTVSVEDRIADKLVPEEQAEAPEQEAEGEAPEGDDAQEAEVSEPELVEVEIGGERYQVPPSIKDAIMRESDYTKKTTELANTRRAVEMQHKELALVAERRKFDESVAEDARMLDMIDAYVTNQEQTTDWASLNTDQIVRARMEIDQLKSRREQLRASLEARWGEFKTKLEGERTKIRQELGEALSKSIPSWSDEVKGSIEKYVAGLGYPEPQVHNMGLQDYQVAWKAMQYDRLQADKATAVQKATQKTAKVIAPSSRKAMPKETQQYLTQRKALKTAKSSSEKSRVIADMLGDRFG